MNWQSVSYTHLSTFNKPLTDKEKRELEKAAKEKQKIKETYQESELALMDEGLEKELAKIGLAYSKKIAAVKGYSCLLYTSYRVWWYSSR